MLAQSVFFTYITFNLFVSLYLKCISCVKHIVESSFVSQIKILLKDELSLFACINMTGVLGFTLS